MNIAKHIFGVIRGDHISSRSWKYILLAAFLAFIMVYSSVSMDQKVYRMKKLKQEYATLVTQFVELHTGGRLMSTESSLMKVFEDKGFEVSGEPFELIIVK